MNKRVGEKLIEIARALKPSKATGQYFHVSSLIRKNRIVCIGWNDYNRVHPFHKFGKYENYKGFNDNYRASIHAETACAIKMGLEDLSEYTLVNIRVGNNNGQILLSQPCRNCYNQIIRGLGIRRCFYTDQNGQFQELAIE